MLSKIKHSMIFIIVLLLLSILAVTATEDIIIMRIFYAVLNVCFFITHWEYDKLRDKKKGVTKC